MDRSKRWLQRQVAPTLAKVFRNPDDGAKFVADLIDRGGERLDEQHLRALEAILTYTRQPRSHVPIAGDTAKEVDESCD